MASMIFSTSHKTPLYSGDWIPTSGGAYAGTCIFLVVLAILSRCIQAYSTILETRWRDKASKRRYIVVAGETEAEREKQLGFRDASEKNDEATLTVRGLDERVRVLSSPRRKCQTQPWRLSTDLPRASIFTVLSGVKYLLYVYFSSLRSRSEVLIASQHVGSHDDERWVLPVRASWALHRTAGDRTICDTRGRASLRVILRLH